MKGRREKWPGGLDVWHSLLGQRRRLNWDDRPSFRIPRLGFLGFVIVDMGAEGPGFGQWQYVARCRCGGRLMPMNRTKRTEPSRLGRAKDGGVLMRGERSALVKY